MQRLQEDYLKIMSWLEKIKFINEKKTLIENTTYVGNITTKTFLVLHALLCQEII